MKQTVDLITVEIGSTITKINAYQNFNSVDVCHVGQGIGLTTVLEGDVMQGVQHALQDLSAQLGGEVEWKEMLAASSAAGGLKMTVHGLTYDMTARAAREASLGAGAIIHMITAGKLLDSDIQKITDIRPNIIILAGGVDYGEREVILYNAQKLAKLSVPFPVIYAGNIVLRNEIQQLFASTSHRLEIVPNVYPAVDELDIQPAREAIQHAFARHIIHAPGMEGLEPYLQTEIMPVPAAVLKAAEMLAEDLGDTLIVDIGGATTDVHSVTDGSPEFQALMIEPEPHAKRTVEGDLGVFVNAKNLQEIEDRLHKIENLENLKALPQSEQEKKLSEALAMKALKIGLYRHAGDIKVMFTATGKKKVVQGKDLTSIKWLIGTGGALTRLPHGEKLLRDVCVKDVHKKLLPKESAQVRIDRKYILASLGLISRDYPEDAKKLAQKYLEF